MWDSPQHADNTCFERKNGTDTGSQESCFKDEVDEEDVDVLDADEAVTPLRPPLVGDKEPSVLED